MANRSLLPRWAGGLLILLVLSDLTGAQLVGQKLTLSGAGEEGLIPDYSAEWEAVDAALGLGVLWGSIDPFNDADPAWVIRPDGKAFLVWGAWDGGDHDLFLSIRPPSGTWSVPVRVHPDDSTDDVTPSPALDTGGYLHVAWVRTAGGGGDIMHSVRVGASWTAALPISDGADSRRPLTWIGSGHTYVTFRTATLRITSEIILYVGAGVSDDIDPTQVDSEERWHEFVPQ